MFHLVYQPINIYYNISKDSEFDSVVDFWTEKGYSIKRQESIVIKEKVVEEKSEEQPKSRPRRTYTRKTSSSGRTTTRTGRPKVVTKPQAKKPRTTTRPTVTDKQKAEIRSALKGAELSAPDYKKVYDALASCENASAYNNKLQKSLGNDKTSVVYKATSIIFENAKK